MKTITLEQIMSFDPCDTYPRERVEILIDGRESVNAIDILKWELDSTSDYIWILLRPELLPDKLLHEVAIYAAELVLPIWEKQYPDDSRPRDAIEAKKKWMRGDITDDELNAAGDAAWAAARDAAWDAWDAWDAAWDAAGDAARDAARDAAWDAWDAWDAAWAAAGAARDAAWDAARDAARDEINNKIMEFIRRKV